MKFAICNETFQDWPLDKAFAFAAECGYTGIEIAPFTLAARRPRDHRRPARPKSAGRPRPRAWRSSGLHWLLAKTEGFHLTTPDADVRRRTAEYFGDLARLCADLGGTHHGVRLAPAAEPAARRDARARR